MRKSYDIFLLLLSLVLKCHLDWKCVLSAACRWWQFDVDFKAQIERNFSYMLSVKNTYNFNSVVEQVTLIYVMAGHSIQWKVIEGHMPS